MTSHPPSKVCHPVTFPNNFRYIYRKVSPTLARHKLVLFGKPIPIRILNTIEPLYLQLTFQHRQLQPDSWISKMNNLSQSYVLALLHQIILSDYHYQQWLAPV